MKKRAFVFALAIVPLGSFGSLATSSVVEEPSLIAPHAVHTETQSVLSTTEEIIFIFDTPRAADTITVNIMPRVAFTTQWNETRTTLTIFPENIWKYGTTYKISLTPHGDTLHAPSVFYTFYVEDIPHIISSVPRSNDPATTLVDDREIQIMFDRSVQDFDIIASAEGYSNIKQQYDAQQKIMTLTLPDPIVAKKAISLKIYGTLRHGTIPTPVLLGDVILNVMPSKPEIWPTNPTERLVIASESAQPYLTEGKYIDVNLEARITTLFEDGKIIRQFINSPGAQDTPTPRGVYRIENKALKPTSAMFGVLLPFWMAFTPDGKYGFHDLIEWPANHPDFPTKPQGGKESLASIDQAVSPGCVRHDSADSQDFYAWADIGTPVKIY